MDHRVYGRTMINEWYDRGCTMVTMVVTVGFIAVFFI